MRRLLLYLLVSAAFISEPAFCQSLSPSKLSAHLINNYTAGSSNIVSGRPVVLKVLALDSGWPSGMVQAMRDYRAKASGGKIIVRVYSPKQYTLTHDATWAAGDFWTNILKKSLDYLSSSDRALIDYLEGPNEGQTPTLGYPWESAAQASQWFNQFWTNLTPRIVAAGHKPCIGSIAVGNPGGDVQDHLTAFVPALRQAKAAGGAWSYHAYTIQYTTDVGVEYWYSLRYRQFYSFFASSFPDLSDMPLILTEGGVDESGNPATSGWSARGSQADYQRWLNWFDQQLRADSYVMGCTLFQNGDPSGWGSFDLEPIASWFREYLPPPSAPPPAPSGLSATSAANGIVLSWTNAPLNPTVYAVKRSTSISGPFSAIATNVTEGVRSNAFTDTSAVAGTDYYYSVTARNSAGESAASAPIYARSTNALPDVVITQVGWSPAVISNGNHVVFWARVLNRGLAPTPAGTILGVGFNVDGAGTASWSGGYNTSLAVNSSVLLWADGGPTGNYWTATRGSHKLIATVDDVNRFPEIAEDNNAYTANFYVNFPAPVITACVVSNAAATVAWRGFSGTTYVLQSRTNLAGANWESGPTTNSAGTNVSATWNGITTRRFFRILQLD